MDTPEQIAEEADQWLRRRSVNDELPELEVEAAAIRLIDGFREAFKVLPEASKALNEKFWDTPHSSDPFLRFSFNGRRYAIQYIRTEIGNIFLKIDRTGLEEETLLINLMMNRTASQDPSKITYINRTEVPQTGRVGIENTPLAVSRAGAILEDLRRSQPFTTPGDSSR
ncbi:hypothetical protein HYT74_01365 [Candidatus Daviesbacteria bacterium]|nr:hypothetical protein [Candidatus Daviesbacteria bacterium]